MLNYCSIAMVADATQHEINGKKLYEYLLYSNAFSVTQ